ncbi:late competence protein ComER [Microaerobacter geothermalis]|uniref:late competence protein ComER n=1 Tax=Microaerobacter geothermalis TaxID=674972 RepID=UPI001F274680|nr:late competence protein ComER [Microaerobacter geothermalis]MCF6092898.1 late competence protein ComER [Microaerobacter geothermalis]
MQLGFIGTGNMGGMLIEALIQSSYISASQVTAINRTREKVIKLAARYPGLKSAETIKEMTLHCDIIFICVKPMEYRKVMQELHDGLFPHQFVVSITSPVMIANLETNLPCKVVKMIPSITNSAFAGASLVVWGTRLTKEDKEYLLTLFQQFSHPVIIEEEETRVSSDIISCGPAFFGYLLQQFIEGAVEEIGISREKATALATEMMIGLGELLSSEKYNLETLVNKVCVPGGVTGAGLTALEEMAKPMFHQLFQRTHMKFYEDVEEMKKHFES